MDPLPYGDFLEAFPQPYLVVGIVGPLTPKVATDHGPSTLLAELIRAQRPKGQWAIGEMADGQRFNLHCVFQLKADADKLASAVQAGGIGRYPGFLAQREFAFGREMQKAVRTVLRTVSGGAGTTASPAKQPVPNANRKWRPPPRPPQR